MVLDRSGQIHSAQIHSGSTEMVFIVIQNSKQYYRQDNLHLNTFNHLHDFAGQLCTTHYVYNSVEPISILYIAVTSKTFNTQIKDKCAASSASMLSAQSTSNKIIIHMRQIPNLHRHSHIGMKRNHGNLAFNKIRGSKR